MIIDQIQSKLETTEVIIDVSLKVYATIDLLSLLVTGAYQMGYVYTNGKVDLCKIRVASSKSELVMRYFGLSQLMRSTVISTDHGNHHTKLVLSLFGSIQTPSTLKPDAMVNPRAGGWCCTISAK